MRLGLVIISMVLCPTAAVSDPLQESWCVDALEQVAALQAISPVYKPSDDGPQFIDDADRPAEIARLQKIIRTSCSTKPKERNKQESEAFRLHVARSPECGIESEKLSAMEMPNSRDPKDSIAQQRKLVAEKCPPVRLRNRWIVFTTGSIDEPSLGGLPGEEIKQDQH